MTDTRIILAAAMGWKQDADGTWFREGHPEDSTWSSLIFDPENKAADCETLIAWLTEQGWYVEISFQTYPIDEECEDRDDSWAFGVFLHVWNIDTEQHERVGCEQSNWKRCLCDLAASVTDEQVQPNG